MRAGAHQLIVDIGPIGAYAHGHADLLSVQCSIFGEPCLVDAGTFGYTADMAWRDYFRNTAAHNTVRIDNLDQAPGAGPFGWQQRPRVRLRAWQSTSEVDVVDAEHHGYIAQGIPVIHRRRVAFVKPDFWIVIDDLIGHGHHQVEWAFQCAPLPVALDAERAACVDTASGAALWIVPVTVPGLQADVKSGERAPIRGWISPAYGRRVAAPMIVYSTGGTLPMRCVTVLIHQQRHDPKPIVLSQTGAGDLPERIHVQPANALVRIDDTHVQVDRG
jgi:hypothetical protein